MAALGVHSEVGTLRTVLVCRPGLAHQRLTPGNRAELLFDDLLWVQEAKGDHYDFVLKMQERGVEVLELHDLLAETVTDKDARAWILDRRVTPNDVGIGIAPTVRAWLDELPAQRLAEHLIGGVAILDLPKSEQAAILAAAYGATDFLGSEGRGGLPVREGHRKEGSDRRPRRPEQDPRRHCWNDALDG